MAAVLAYRFFFSCLRYCCSYLLASSISKAGLLLNKAILLRGFPGSPLFFFKGKMLRNRSWHQTIHSHKPVLWASRKTPYHIMGHISILITRMDQRCRGTEFSCNEQRPIKVAVCINETHATPTCQRHLERCHRGAGWGHPAYSNHMRNLLRARCPLRAFSVFSSRFECFPILLNYVMRPASNNAQCDS